jgi:hypothetical protein
MLINNKKLWQNNKDPELVAERVLSASDRARMMTSVKRKKKADSAERMMLAQVHALQRAASSGAALAVEEVILVEKVIHAPDIQVVVVAHAEAVQAKGIQNQDFHVAVVAAGLMVAAKAPAAEALVAGLAAILKAETSRHIQEVAVRVVQVAATANPGVMENAAVVLLTKELVAERAHAHAGLAAATKVVSAGSVEATEKTLTSQKEITVTAIQEGASARREASVR